MLTNLDNINAVIDHREATDQSLSVYEVCVEYAKEDLHPDDKFAWMPFTEVYKELPGVMQEYFSLKKVSLENILNLEVEARKNKGRKPRGNKFSNQNRSKRRTHYWETKEPGKRIYTPIKRDFVEVA
jgi:hypothetical protein